MVLNITTVDIKDKKQKVNTTNYILNLDATKY